MCPLALCDSGRVAQVRGNVKGGEILCKMNISVPKRIFADSFSLKEGVFVGTFYATTKLLHVSVHCKESILIGSYN